MLFLFSLFFVEFVFGARLINCPLGTTKFEKVIGLRPPKSYNALLLYQDPKRGPVTSQCLSTCLANKECLSFVLYYNDSACYWYRTEVQAFDEQDSFMDPNVSWFLKTCLNASNCQKSWIFERIPGAILIGNDTQPLPNLVTREECQQSCLNVSTFHCKSAKFRIIEDYGSNATEIVGKCTLSDTDRHLMPNSYRVSRSDEEYFENQCLEGNSIRVFAETTNEFCSFEEYENSTLSHSDASYQDKTKENCEKLCDQTTAFNCRGYTLLPSQFRQNIFTCLIHSEDSKIFGPKLVVDHMGAKYYEKAPCLNVSVTCSETNMIIRYQPNVDFFGKIYTQGYSENPECFASGRNKNIVTLKIPLVNHHCGITEAKNSLNRTLLSTTMVLQYNSLVQTQADRIIRVGCIFGNSTTVLVGTGVNFTESYPNIGTTLVNSTSGLPSVEMKIIDLHTQKEIIDTQIGQELQLIIEVKPATDPFDIWAGHLVAMTETGQDSILLLDDRGCPTNLDIFPQLIKTSDNSSKTLVATFQAFKFSSSAVIRFSVIVQFCSNECPKVDCGNYINNRTRRNTLSKLNLTTNGTTIKNVNKKQFDTKGKNIVQEMPLEFIITVQDSKLSSDKLTYGENNKILVAGYDYSEHEICINYALFIGLMIAWVFIQLIFFITGICLIRRYKRYYENECVRESLEELHKNFGLGFSNLDNRRVHFADNTTLT